MRAGWVVTADQYRHVLGRLPTGVVAVCGENEGRLAGLICGSFMSASLDPPLVTLCPAKTSRSWPHIANAGRFCANVLGAGQTEIATRFATSGGDKFADLSWRPAPATGSPQLAGSAAWIDCRIDRTIEAGDHWLVIAEVLDLAVESAESPLVFHCGDFCQLLSGGVRDSWCRQ
ncbi:MAG: flavin reductase family protein [Solirubrobacteraceae bacterium]